MPQQVITNLFLIRRLTVQLLVTLRSTGLVKIEPFQCKPEQMRLWSSIANTQTTLAQLQLEQTEGGDNVAILYALFQRGGWDIKALEERKEFSL